MQNAFDRLAVEEDTAELFSRYINMDEDASRHDFAQPFCHSRSASDSFAPHMGALPEQGYFSFADDGLMSSLLQLANFEQDHYVGSENYSVTSDFPNTDPHLTTNIQMIEGSSFPPPSPSESIDATVDIPQASAFSSHDHNHNYVRDAPIDHNVIIQEMGTALVGSEMLHQCQVCFKCFSKRGYLENHLYSKHHNFPKPWRCVTCGRCFSSRTAASRHKAQVHALPVRCSECGNHFSRVDYLKDSGYHKRSGACSRAAAKKKTTCKA